MSVNTESIEAAARALHEFNPTFAQDKWDATELDYRSWRREQATAALTAAATFIQAAALRDAAVDLCSEKCDDNYAPDYCETCRAVEALHARADQLEDVTP